VQMYNQALEVRTHETLPSLNGHKLTIT